ncbi:MAG TPA: hypothetical protein VL527_11635 [Dongiaceae bacterium]|nr:hypothetical protein [Dongiaceae bacterium]
MTLRRNVFLTVLLGLCAACHARAEGLSPKDIRTSEVHWLGLNRVVATTNAANFLKVWNLPETVKVKERLLSDISHWLAAGNTNAANSLRPLLDDAVAGEAYAEWTPAANGTVVRLAFRLPAARQHFWDTNLASALELAAGGKPEPATAGKGWVWHHATAPRRVEFQISGDWTLVEVGDDSGAALSDFAARVAQAAAGATNAGDSLWVQADLNFKDLLTAAFPAAKGEISPAARITFTATGEGGEVRTRAEVDLGLAGKMALPAWQIPTNLIHQPLSSFTAIRGFGSWLARQPFWRRLQLNPAPNQIYFWAEPASPAQTYCAFPLTNATAQLYQLAGQLITKGNNWIYTNGEGRFEWKPNPPAIVWLSAPFMTPFLRPEKLNQQDYVFGGFIAPGETDTNAPPPETLRHVQETPDLVYYQAELTGPQIADDLWNSQLFRVALHRAQLPPDTVSIPWIKLMEHQLGPSITSVVQADSGRLVLTRTSTVGFTALELHLLADWMESPQFPRGLHTLLAPPEN